MNKLELDDWTALRRRDKVIVTDLAGEKVPVPIHIVPARLALDFLQVSDEGDIQTACALAMGLKPDDKGRIPIERLDRFDTAALHQILAKAIQVNLAECSAVVEAKKLAVRELFPALSPLIEATTTVAMQQAIRAVRSRTELLASAFEDTPSSAGAETPPTSSTTPSPSSPASSGNASTTASASS